MTGLDWMILDAVLAPVLALQLWALYGSWRTWRAEKKRDAARKARIAAICRRIREVTP